MGTADWIKQLKKGGKGKEIGNTMAQISKKYGCGWDIDIERASAYTQHEAEITDVVTTYRQQCPVGTYMLSIETGSSAGTYGGVMGRFFLKNIAHFDLLNAMVGGSSCDNSCNPDFFTNDYESNSISRQKFSYKKKKAFSLSLNIETTSSFLSSSDKSNVATNPHSGDG